MRIFIQSDEGAMLASIVNGEVYSLLGAQDRDRVAFEVWKTLQALTRVMPSASVGIPNELHMSDEDVHGGTP